MQKPRLQSHHLGPPAWESQGPVSTSALGDWAGEGTGRCMRADPITHTAGPSSSLMAARPPGQGVETEAGDAANSNSATPQPSPHLCMHSEETSSPLNTLTTVLRQASHTSLTHDLISSSRFEVQHICKSTIDQKRSA